MANSIEMISGEQLTELAREVSFVPLSNSRHLETAVLQKLN